LKRLFILRHAKAVPAEPSAEDFARALAPRGHADAGRLGAYLNEHNLLPDLVLCSPARRTQETWQDISQALGKTPRVEFVETFYLASATAIFAELRKDRGKAASLMVIGHNPGLENLALHLVRKPKEGKAKDRLRALTEGMPTCALAMLEFDIESWKKLDAAQGELEIFLRPKDLKA
jgi:phosphohistidine phosphatase